MSTLAKVAGLALIVAACFALTTAAAALALHRPDVRVLATDTTSRLKADYSRDAESSRLRRLSQDVREEIESDERALAATPQRVERIAVLLQPTATPVGSATPRSTATVTVSPTPQASATPRATETAPASPSATAFPITPAPVTAVPTVGIPPTVGPAPPTVAAPSPTFAAPSATPTVAAPTSTPTAAPTSTASPTATASPTPSPTASSTSTPTPSPTATLTSTPVPTATSTPTPTLTPTATFTMTFTPTPTPTATLTPTPTPTLTPSPTPTVTATPTATTVVLSADEDTYLDEASPGSGHGSDTLLQVDANGSGSAARLLVKFDVTGSVPQNAALQSATLRLCMQNILSAAVGRTHEIHEVVASWSEGSASWSTMPPFLGQDIDTVTVPLATGCVTFDVTATVQLWVNSAPEQGFLVKDSDESAGLLTGVSYASSEHGAADQRPQLTVIYTP